MSTLCNTCMGINLDEIVPAARSNPPRLDDRRPKYKHHASYANLKASAQDGCELCEAIILEIRHFALLKDPVTGRDANQDFEFWKSQKSQIYLKLKEPVYTDGSCRELLVISFPKPRFSAIHGEGEYGTLDVLFETSESNHPYSLSLETNITSEKGRTPGILTSGRQISSRPGSEVAFALANQWLQDCLQHHRWCGPKRPHCTLPTRVIDVGPADGSEEPRLMNGDGRIGQWTSLSHTWGSLVTLTTTKDTIRARALCIPMSQLPMSFHDAVIITRKLGIRYLWIDSLASLLMSRNQSH